MTSTNPSNDTSAVTAAQGQDKKEVHMQHNIESLLQNLREMDTLLAESVEALIAEKDALLVEKHEQLSVALANNNMAPTHTLAHSNEDGSEADAPVLKAKVRTNEEVRLIRQMTQRGGSEWKGLSYDAPEAEDETVSGEDHGHGSRTPWYGPPIQRQRWDEDQILPHVNWGDIFFDLFYVGAAYNL